MRESGGVNLGDVASKRRYRWPSAQEKSEIRRLRRDERLSVDAIAKRFRRAKSTVFGIVKDIPEPTEGWVRAPRGRRLHSKLPERETIPRKFAHLSTAKKGRLAELYFEAECIIRGIELSRPIVDCRYDYLALIGGSPKRIQIKWADGRTRNGAVMISLARPRGLRSAGAKGQAFYDRSEVDFIVAYVAAVSRFVVLEPNHFHQKASFVIRVDVPRNGQIKSINFVDDLAWNEASLS